MKVSKQLVTTLGLGIVVEIAIVAWIWEIPQEPATRGRRGTLWSPFINRPVRLDEYFGSFDSWAPRRVGDASYQMDYEASGFVITKRLTRDTQGRDLHRAIVPLDFDRLHWWRFRVFQGRAQWFLLCSDDDFAAGTLVFAEDAGLGADLDLRARNLFIGEDTRAFGAVKDMSWPDESGSSEGWAILEHHGPSVIRLLDTDGDGIPDTLGTALVSIDDCPHLRLARSLSFRCEDGEPTWSISCAPMGSDLSWGVGDWTLQLRDLDGDGRADWKNLVQPLPDGRRLGRRE